MSEHKINRAVISGDDYTIDVPASWCSFDDDQGVLVNSDELNIELEAENVDSIEIRDGKALLGFWENYNSRVWKGVHPGSFRPMAEGSPLQEYYFKKYAYQR
jgi:hypothetical protein